MSLIETRFCLGPGHDMHLCIFDISLVSPRALQLCGKVSKMLPMKVTHNISLYTKQGIAVIFNSKIDKQTPMFIPDSRVLKINKNKMCSFGNFFNSSLLF